jgi:glycosyltransferase involved in cell wall biosynthesis
VPDDGCTRLCVAHQQNTKGIGPITKSAVDNLESMRIVMIGPFAWAPKGTVSARAFLLGRALVERGHQVTLIMPPYDNPPHAGWDWARDGVHLINMPLPSWGDSVRARLSVPLAMARRAIGLKPDLVHVFKPLGYAGLTGLYLRLFWPRLPLVLDSDDWEGRGGWADVNPYPRLWRWVFAWQEGWLARHADAVTVASRTLQTQMWGLGLSPQQVFYLPNGPSPLLRECQVSPAEQRELRQALGVGDAPLALYIGHVSYGSEVSLIVEALPIVRAAIPEIRVVIVGAGDGIAALHEQAQRAGLGERLLFTGWVDHQQLPAYLAAADLTLYPHRDTLVNRAKSPSKITAYMAMGKPIVASAVGEIVEYLEAGHAGLLVEPGNVRAFAKGMIALLNDPARAAELGRRARQRIWEHYDWTRRALTAEEAYGIAMPGGAET